MLGYAGLGGVALADVSGEAQATDSGANPHFLGVFKPPTFARLPSFSADTSESAPPQPETQPHFIARLREPKFSLLTLLRQNFDTAQSGPLPTQPETNTQFLARPWPVGHSVSSSLRQNTPFDGSGPVPPPPPPPPGSGKRYQPPTDYLPEPAWDERPRKPVRPIWDRGGEVHKEQPAPSAPSAPVPLPPLSIFGSASGQLDLTALPTFGQYEISRPLALEQRLRDAKARALADHNQVAIVLILDALDEPDEDDS